MFDIGLEELYRRYSSTAKAIRYAVSEMGLELVPSGHACPGCDSPDRYCANTATAIRYPDGIQHEALSRIMREKYNISIAGTYGPLAGKAFRLGPTGLQQIQNGFTLNLLGCLGMALQQLGFPVNVDKALAVADKILNA
jgi:aspartate aminotransferase-like enzyme